MNKYSATGRSTNKKAPSVPTLTPSIDLLERTPPMVKHSEYIPVRNTDSKGLSQLSRLRNNMINSLPSLSVSLSCSQSIELKPYMRDKDDYAKLMEQLDAIICINQAQKPITLDEKCLVEKLTEQGKIQYFKVNCIGKRCPLKIKVKKSYGLLDLYVAKNKLEPTSDDICIKKDIVSISDVSKTFKTEFVGIAVQAITDVKYRICIKFGKLFLNLNPSQQLESTRTLKLRKAQSIKGKNFILLNKINGYHKEMETFKKWKDRRKNAVQNKMNIIKKKKQRSIELINRNIAIRKNIIREHEKQEIITKEKDRQRNWILFLYISKMIHQVREVVKARREERIRVLILSQTIVKVQKRFRKVFSDVRLNNMVRCHNSLMLYGIVHPRSYQFLANFVKESRLVCRPFQKMMKFKWSIEVIQNEWKIYSKRNYQRWEDLLLYWDNAIEKLKVKKRKLRYKRYERDVILRDFFKEKKKNYVKQVKGFLTNSQRKCFPSFKFLPSDTELLGMVKKLT